MKKLLVLAVLMSGNVWAGSRVILKDQKKMIAEVSKETVKCSELGYGQTELKINIAGLDGWTLMDHTNDRFGDSSGLPCMTAGICKGRFSPEGLSIDDILQNNPREEAIVVFREVTETREFGERTYTQTGENGKDEEVAYKVCNRHLTEAIKTIVGGVHFKHSRKSLAEELPAKSCTF